MAGVAMTAQKERRREEQQQEIVRSLLSGRRVAVGGGDGDSSWNLWVTGVYGRVGRTPAPLL